METLCTLSMVTCCTLSIETWAVRVVSDRVVRMKGGLRRAAVPTSRPCFACEVRHWRTATCQWYWRRVLCCAGGAVVVSRSLPSPPPGNMLPRHALFCSVRRHRHCLCSAAAVTAAPPKNADISQDFHRIVTMRNIDIATNTVGRIYKHNRGARQRRWRRRVAGSDNCRMTRFLVRNAVSRSRPGASNNIIHDAGEVPLRQFEWSLR